MHGTGRQRRPRRCQLQQGTTTRRRRFSGCADLLVRFRAKPRSGEVRRKLPLAEGRRQFCACAPVRGPVPCVQAQRGAVPTCMEQARARCFAASRSMRTRRSAHPENGRRAARFSTATGLALALLPLRRSFVWLQDFVASLSEPRQGSVGPQQVAERQGGESGVVVAQCAIGVLEPECPATRFRQVQLLWVGGESPGIADLCGRTGRMGSKRGQIAFGPGSRQTRVRL